jgi:AcrR family transcriptional regulator
VILGVKERHERNGGGRAGNLDAARELFVAEGYRNVSIRKIAEKSNTTLLPSTAISPARTTSSSRLRKLRMLFAPGPDLTIADPIDKIRAGFWRIPSARNIQILRVDVPRPIGAAHQQGLGTFRFHQGEGLHVGSHSERHRSGLLPPDTKADGFRILAAAIHGAAVMRLCGRLSPNEDADALARDTLEAALTGLRTGIPHTFHSEPCE